MNALNHEVYPEANTSSFLINGKPFVFQSNYFLIYMVKLAKNARLLNAPQLMVQAAEESFYDIFMDYFRKQGLRKTSLKVKIVEEYFRLMGLGHLTIDVSKAGGSAKIKEPNLDKVWIQVFSNTDKPVNFIAQGFIGAAFSAINNKPKFSYEVIEWQSRACGSSLSQFNIIKKTSQEGN